MTTSASTSNTQNKPNGSNQVAERIDHSLPDETAHVGARTGQIANETFNQLSSAVETARNATVPALERLGSGAESLARRSAEAARATSQQLREQAHRGSEYTVGYIRNEPVKSVLLAAAAGALIGLLLSFSRRDR